ncbi:MAG TPA: MFS transporter [Roseiflexaceae bacterium]|nr:MFS transporter [Roseiflexaceae bacterium]
MSQRITLFICFAVGYFLSNFYRAANAVIAGDLGRDLQLTAADLGLMTSLFYAGFALVQLPLGAALDRLGPRVTLPALMMATAAGSLLFASAHSFAPLAAGRTLIGVGMAGMLMGAIKAFGAWFDPRRVATITSLLVGIGASGGLAAATPLAWLNERFGWRAVFLWGAVAVLVSAAGIALGTRNAPRGVAWRAAPGAPGGGFGQIFRDLRFWRIAPLNFFLIGTMLAVQTLWGGPYLFDVLHLAPVQAGNLLLFLSGGVVAGYFACGPLADRFGAQRVTVAAVAVFAAAQLVFLLPGWMPPAALIAVVFFGFGFTGAFNLLQLAEIRALFPPHMSGRAATAVNMFGFAGAALLQWWMGLIIGAFPRDTAGHYPPAAYAAAFGFTLVGTALALAWYASPGGAWWRQDVERSPGA